MNRLVIKLILLSIISFSSVYGNDNNQKDYSEFGFRAWNQTFTPYEYQRIKDTDYDLRFNVGDLKGNKSVIKNWFFKNRFYDGSFGLEIETFSIKNDNLSYDLVNNILNNPQYRIVDFPVVSRDDYKINFYFYDLLPTEEYLYFGLGIRKIDKLTRLNRGINRNEERISTGGIQFSIRSDLQVTEKLSFNFGIDLFHTEGRRNLNNHLSANLLFEDQGVVSYFEFINPSHNTKGIYQGYEFIAQIKYNLLENINIFAGYNYNFLYMRYKNLNDIQVAIIGTQPPRIFVDDRFQIGNSSEIIEGIFFGASLTY